MSSGAPDTGDANAFASLSSSLLARKGHAKPAMRPQGFHVHHETSPESLEDLGWNDMGQEARTAKLVPLTPAVSVDTFDSEEPPVPVLQQQEIEREFTPADADFVEVQRPMRAAAGTKAKAAFTLRLDGERHLRLRLICAIHHRSAQQIVTQALDEFLARQPSNVDLAKSSRS